MTTGRGRVARGRSERAAHALVYLLDDSHQRLSFVMEEIFLHIDMESRKTAPWPDDVAAAMDHRGVVNVMTPGNRPPLQGDPDAKPFMFAFRFEALQDNTVRYANQPIALVLAETVEAATEGARLLNPQYESLAPRLGLDGGTPVKAWAALVYLVAARLLKLARFSALDLAAWQREWGVTDPATLAWLDHATRMI